MDLAAIITAHNEAATLGRLLPVVLGEEFPHGRLRQVVVVSSGSTDATDETVAGFARRDPRVALVTEPARRGKCAAINLALRHKEPADVVILLSADVLPEPGALARLVEPLRDPGVGMTGGRPVPGNDPGTLFGYAAQLLWAVHHRVARVRPKLGEVVAFRDVVASIPEELAVDEAALEAQLSACGLRLVYVPDAVIHNRGADNLREFLSQRRRISAGHYHLKRVTGYRVATAGYLPAVRGLLRELNWRPRPLFYAAVTAALCLAGRLLGAYDFFVARRTHRVWDVAASTKQVGEERPAPPES